MIRHEQISVPGVVLYCDGINCYAKGPTAPFDNTDEVVE
jgi:hypothetical protein